MASAANGARAFSTRWSSNSRSSKRRRRRTSSPPRGRRPRARRLARSRARSRRASPSRSICRASGSWFPARPPAPAADRPGSPSSARTSPRRSRWCRGNGRCCNTSGRSSPAGHARRSARPRRRSMCCRAASPARAFSPWCCSRSTGSTSRSTGNRSATGREGVDLSLSTLADQVGGCAALLRPLYDLIRAHVLAGEPRARRRHHRAGSRQRARRRRVGPGSMCATTGRSAGPTRRRRCSTTPVIGPANIPNVISMAMPASCRRTPMPGSIGSTQPTAGRDP